MAAMEEVCFVIAGATLGFMAITGAAYEVSKKKVKKSVWTKPRILQTPLQGAYNFIQWFGKFRWFKHFFNEYDNKLGNRLVDGKKGDRILRRKLACSFSA